VVKLNSQDLRKKFLDFFVKKGHKTIPAASLIPENDPSVLFTTAGVQQFKRYYQHPEEALSSKIVTVQPCFRTSDIDEVGDNTHLTFFEMLGNFSFNDYFKEKAVDLAIEFLTKELNLKLADLEFYIFGGDKEAPRDDESERILKARKITRIKEGNRNNNFWGPTGDEGPCGPTIDIYSNGIEIWSLVFNEYYKNPDGSYRPLETKGVDTGMGLERMLVVLNGLTNVYETDVFVDVIKKIEKITKHSYKDKLRSFRRISDHYRSSIALINAGIRPGKNERESVLRIILRVVFVEINNIISTYKEKKQYENELERAKDILRNTRFLDISSEITSLFDDCDKEIQDVVNLEYLIYQRMFGSGVAYLEKNINKEMITGREIYEGRGTFGLDINGVIELWKTLKKPFSPNIESETKKAQKEHQEISRAGIGMFKGGLVSGGNQETKYHSATHLLLAALRQTLGDGVHQKGSNITAERLRFDFSYPEKLTPEQIRQVEDLVNEKIKEDLPVKMEEMSLEDAKNCGAIGEFGHKYGYKVKVYSMGDFSKEICGGPHVERTGVLGHFKTIKEESSSSGVRRIKAVLE